MKNKYGNLKCEGCGSYNLKLNVSYDGLDEESAAGEGRVRMHGEFDLRKLRTSLHDMPHAGLYRCQRHCR